MSISENELIWKSEYNTGDFKIDSEHQKLFAIGKKALSIVNKNDLKNDLSDLKKIVSELFAYVSTHFSNEEKYMEKLNYPELKRHKVIHKKMISMLKELVDEINSLKIEEIKQKLFDFINEYFIKHIILEDKKIRLYSTPFSKLKKTFGWKDIYSVKNENIDKEHKKLFDIASNAFKEVQEKEKVNKIRVTLTELYNYMKIHFKNEEKYMEEIAYPKIKEHKKLHTNIINTLNSFIKDLPGLDIAIAEKELIKIIDIFLVQHIIQEDRKIISWVK